MGTKASRKELGDLAVVYGELFKRVKDGTRPAGPVIDAVQRLVEGDLPRNTGLDRYNHLLLPLEEQVNRLRHLNAEYWNNYLSEAELSAVDTSGDTAQGVDHLTTFHVEFDSMEQTAEMWREAIRGKQLGMASSDVLQLDKGHLQLARTNSVRTYRPGIHRVKLNLVAHWHPFHDRTIEAAREEALSNDEVLAQLEVLSAYGIHSDLLREQDGQNLPYASLAGTKAMTPGYYVPQVLELSWLGGYNQASLHAVELSTESPWRATPIVL